MARTFHFSGSRKKHLAMAAILVISICPGFSDAYINFDPWEWDPFSAFDQESPENENSRYEEQKQTKLLNLTTSSFDSSYLIVGSLLVGGLLIASVGLYALDVYATSRIDQFLLDYYGPKLYERYTKAYLDPNSPIGLTATTYNDYYGLRSNRRSDQYGLQILEWLEQAYGAYEAAKEAMSNPLCRKRVLCEIKSTPAEDKSWMASNAASIYENLINVEDGDEINQFLVVGHPEVCSWAYPGCPMIEKYKTTSVKRRR